MHEIYKMLKRTACFIVAGTCFVLLSGCGKTNPEERALSPEASMKVRERNSMRAAQNVAAPERGLGSPLIALRRAQD